MTSKVKNDLLALLVLMKNKAAAAAAQKPDYEPTVSTHRVIDILRSNGIPFSYSLLSQLKNDPEIGSYISDLNRDQMTINVEPSNEPEAEPEVPDTGMEQPAAEMPAEPAPEQSGQAEPAGADTVDSMAKRALKRV